MMPRLVVPVEKAERWIETFAVSRRCVGSMEGRERAVVRYILVDSWICSRVCQSLWLRMVGCQISRCGIVDGKEKLDNIEANVIMTDR